MATAYKLAMPPHPLTGRKVSLVLHKFDRGGSPRVAAYLARGFADLGIDVELVVFTSRGDVEGIIVKLMGSDIPVHYLGALNGPRPLDLLRGLPLLIQHLRARQPDIVIAAANNVALVTSLARSSADLVASQLYLKTTNPVASSRHRGFVKAIRRWTYRLAFPTATAVWTLSAPESEEMRVAFPDFADLFHDIANPYVTASMLAAPEVRPAAPRYILGIGRLTAQKRFERLIEAFALVRDKDVHFKILGEGEDRASLTALIERLGLGDRVSMPGYVTNVAEAFHGAEMMVLPSDYEGLPAVVLEAMAANCPVLSTDCFPAARAIVAGAEGCAIIESTDAATIAGMIDARLGSPRPTRLRAVAERYSISAGIDSHVAAMVAGMRG